MKKKSEKEVYTQMLEANLASLSRFREQTLSAPILFYENALALHEAEKELEVKKEVLRQAEVKCDEEARKAILEEGKKVTESQVENYICADPVVKMHREAVVNLKFEVQKKRSFVRAVELRAEAMIAVAKHWRD